MTKAKQVQWLKHLAFLDFRGKKLKKKVCLLLSYIEQRLPIFNAISECILYVKKYVCMYVLYVIFYLWTK